MGGWNALVEVCSLSFSGFCNDFILTQIKTILFCGSVCLCLLWLFIFRRHFMAAGWLWRDQNTRMSCWVCPYGIKSSLNYDIYRRKDEQSLISMFKHSLPFLCVRVGLCVRLSSSCQWMVFELLTWREETLSYPTSRNWVRPGWDIWFSCKISSVFSRGKLISVTSHMATLPHPCFSNTGQELKLQYKTLQQYQQILTHQSITFI